MDDRKAQKQGQQNKKTDNSAKDKKEKESFEAVKTAQYVAHKPLRVNKNFGLVIKIYESLGCGFANFHL